MLKSIKSASITGAKKKCFQFVIQINLKRRKKETKTKQNQKPKNNSERENHCHTNVKWVLLSFFSFLNRSVQKHSKECSDHSSNQTATYGNANPVDSTAETLPSPDAPNTSATLMHSKPVLPTKDILV